MGGHASMAKRGWDPSKYRWFEFILVRSRSCRTCDWLKLKHILLMGRSVQMGRFVQNLRVKLFVGDWYLPCRCLWIWSKIVTWTGQTYSITFIITLCFAFEMYTPSTQRFIIVFMRCMSCYGIICKSSHQGLMLKMINVIEGDLPQITFFY